MLASCLAFCAAVVVVPYNYEWPETYTKEAVIIRSALGDNCTEIHHVGSTSVPELAAKPIIDIVPVVTDITEVKSKLLDFGYRAIPEKSIPLRLRFERIDDEGTEYKVMIFEKDNPEIPRLISFRDSLRRSFELRDEYAKLKYSLAKQFSNDIERYTAGKNAFIQKVDMGAGTDLPRIIFDVVPELTFKCNALLGVPAENCNEFRNFVLIQSLKILAVARISVYEEDGEDGVEKEGKLEVASEIHEKYNDQLELMVRKWATLEKIKLESFNL